MKIKKHSILSVKILLNSERFHHTLLKKVLTVTDATILQSSM